MRRFRAGASLAALALAWTLSGEAPPSPKKPEGAFAAGGYHCLALDREGRLWSWGCNQHGGLGDGTTERRLVPVRAMDPPEASRLVSLAAGEDHSLALDAEGHVWAFGRNDEGQLGDGTTKDQPVRTLVRGLKEVLEVSAGPRHSLALTRSGEVWAWGGDGDGQLGLGAGPGSRVPRKVPGLTGVAAISAGGRFSLALRRDGTVWAWGTFPREHEGGMERIPAPRAVPGLDGITAIAAGGRHALALRRDGTVWAWGMNDYGQLGDGTTISRSVPLAVPGLAHVRQVSAGYDHGMAVLDNGTAWSWGDNNQGQLGNAVSESSPVPVQVSGWEGPLKDLEAVRCGGYHSLLLTRQRRLLACGQNVFGQLGNWKFADSALPSEVWKQVLQTAP